MRLASPTVKALRSRLLEWFDRSKRDLPWRKDPTPYRVFVSEIMLQQTQVETVIPYFHRFIEAFPTFKALAQAEEEEVLRLWSGLGYYRRARNLHQAAQKIVTVHRGRFPKELERALEIPGVGRYTAGATLSIAYGLRVPLVDGNVERVLSRVFALMDDLSNGPGKKVVWDLADQLVPDDRPGDFNQALMELGALTCAPIGPKCLTCPISNSCRGYREGLAESLPVKTRKQEQVKVEEVVLLLKRGDQYLLTNQNEESLYGGMWQFPWVWRMEGEYSLKSTLKRLMRSLELLNLPARELHTLSHGITFRRIETTFFLAEIEDSLNHSAANLRWVKRAVLAQEALPGYQRKVLGIMGD